MTCINKLEISHFLYTFMQIDGDFPKNRILQISHFLLYLLYVPAKYGDTMYVWVCMGVSDNDCMYLYLYMCGNV